MAASIRRTCARRRGLVVTGNFACGLAFYNTAARYLFALGRERVLPVALARTSRRGGPVVAAMTVTTTVALYCLAFTLYYLAFTLYYLAFTLYDPSTEAALLKLGTWSPLLGILAVQALVCVAIIRFFRTEAMRSRHPDRYARLGHVER